MGCNNTTNNRHQEIIKKNQNIDSSKLSNVSKIIQEPEKNKGIIQVNPSNYAMNENYYLICPNCEIRSPHIEKLFYKEDIEDFMVKYTCICFDNTREPKEIQLIKILGKTEPKNTCIIHPENKLKNFCLTCRKAICQICENESHKYHKIENSKNLISKEDADKMLQIINDKEQKFNDDMIQNEQKIENGFNDMIQKLNEEKINYKKQMENYKDNNKKTFDFLKNLYKRYIEQNENNKENINNNSQYIPENTDIMLNNHVNKFIINDNMTNINSNVDEILTQLDKEKALILKYDYGFQNNNLSSIESSKNEKQKIPSYFEKKTESNKFSCTKTLMGHTNKIVSLIELESGKLVSGSYDNTIRIWDINDRIGNEQVINETERILSLLEFEKNKILSGTGDNSINLWDLENPEQKIYSFKGHELWVNALVKCDSNCFASASNDSKIKIWDYYKRECVSTLKGHVDCILSLILLKNKNLCSGSADLTVRIWDWGLGECVSILKGHSRWVKCVLELDNGVLVTGSDDKTIKLWKDEINFKTLEEHAHSVRTFCQINERYFASGSFDYTIKIWEIDSWKCVQTLYGHELNIICLVSLKYQNENDNEKNGYNELIASCSNDKTIKIWKGIP